MLKYITFCHMSNISDQSDFSINDVFKNNILKQLFQLFELFRTLITLTKLQITKTVIQHDFRFRSILKKIKIIYLIQLLNSLFYEVKLLISTEKLINNQHIEDFIKEINSDLEILNHQLNNNSDVDSENKLLLSQTTIDLIINDCLKEFDHMHDFNEHLFQDLDQKYRKFSKQNTFRLKRLLKKCVAQLSDDILGASANLDEILDNLVTSKVDLASGNSTFSINQIIENISKTIAYICQDNSQNTVQNNWYQREYIKLTGSQLNSMKQLKCRNYQLQQQTQSRILQLEMLEIMLKQSTGSCSDQFNAPASAAILPHIIKSRCHSITTEDSGILLSSIEDSCSSSRGSSSQLFTSDNEEYEVEASLNKSQYVENHEDIFRSPKVFMPARSIEYMDMLHNDSGHYQEDFHELRYQKSCQSRFSSILSEILSKQSSKNKEVDNSSSILSQLELEYFTTTQTRSLFDNCFEQSTQFNNNASCYQTDFLSTPTPSIDQLEKHKNTCDNTKLQYTSLTSDGGSYYPLRYELINTNNNADSKEDIQQNECGEDLIVTRDAMVSPCSLRSSGTSQPTTSMSVHCYSTEIEDADDLDVAELYDDDNIDDLNHKNEPQDEAGDVNNSLHQHIKNIVQNILSTDSNSSGCDAADKRSNSSSTGSGNSNNSSCANTFDFRTSNNITANRKFNGDVICSPFDTIIKIGELKTTISVKAPCANKTTSHNTDGSASCLYCVHSNKHNAVKSENMSQVIFINDIDLAIKCCELTIQIEFKKDESTRQLLVDGKLKIVEKYKHLNDMLKKFIKEKSSLLKKEIPQNIPINSNQNNNIKDLAFQSIDDTIEEVDEELNTEFFTEAIAEISLDKSMGKQPLESCKDSQLDSSSIEYRLSLCVLLFERLLYNSQSFMKSLVNVLERKSQLADVISESYTVKLHCFCLMKFKDRFYYMSHLIFNLAKVVENYHKLKNSLDWVDSLNNLNKQCKAMLNYSFEIEDWLVHRFGDWIKSFNGNVFNASYLSNELLLKMDPSLTMSVAIKQSTDRLLHVICALCNYPCYRYLTQLIHQNGLQDVTNINAMIRQRRNGNYDADLISTSIDYEELGRSSCNLRKINAICAVNIMDLHELLYNVDPELSNADEIHKDINKVLSIWRNVDNESHRLLRSSIVVYQIITELRNIFLKMIALSIIIVAIKRDTTSSSNNPALHNDELNKFQHKLKKYKDRIRYWLEEMEQFARIIYQKQITTKRFKYYLEIYQYLKENVMVIKKLVDMIFTKCVAINYHSCSNMPVVVDIMTHLANCTRSEHIYQLDVAGNRIAESIDNRLLYNQYALAATNNSTNHTIASTTASVNVHSTHYSPITRLPTTEYPMRKYENIICAAIDLEEMTNKLEKSLLHQMDDPLDICVQHEDLNQSLNSCADAYMVLTADEDTTRLIDEMDTLDDTALQMILETVSNAMPDAKDAVAGTNRTSLSCVVPHMKNINTLSKLRSLPELVPNVKDVAAISKSGPQREVLQDVIVSVNKCDNSTDVFTECNVSNVTHSNIRYPNQIADLSEKSTSLIVSRIITIATNAAGHALLSYIDKTPLTTCMSQSGAYNHLIHKVESKSVLCIFAEVQNKLVDTAVVVVSNKKMSEHMFVNNSSEEISCYILHDVSRAILHETILNLSDYNTAGCVLATCSIHVSMSQQILDKTVQCFVDFFSDQHHKLLSQTSTADDPISNANSVTTLSTRTHQYAHRGVANNSFASMMSPGDVESLSISDYYNLNREVAIDSTIVPITVAMQTVKHQTLTIHNNTCMCNIRNYKCHNSHLARLNFLKYSNSIRKYHQPLSLSCIAKSSSSNTSTSTTILDNGNGNSLRSSYVCASPPVIAKDRVPTLIARFDNAAIALHQSASSAFENSLVDCIVDRIANGCISNLPTEPLTTNKKSILQSFVWYHESAPLDSCEVQDLEESIDVVTEPKDVPAGPVYQYAYSTKLLLSNDVQLCYLLRWCKFSGLDENNTLGCTLLSNTDDNINFMDLSNSLVQPSCSTAYYSVHHDATAISPTVRLDSMQTSSISLSMSVEFNDVQATKHNNNNDSQNPLASGDVDNNDECDDNEDDEDLAISTNTTVEQHEQQDSSIQIDCNSFMQYNSQNLCYQLQRQQTDELLLSDIGEDMLPLIPGHTTLTHKPFTSYRPDDIHCASTNSINSLQDSSTQTPQPIATYQQQLHTYNMQSTGNFDNPLFTCTRLAILLLIILIFFMVVTAYIYQEEIWDSYIYEYSWNHLAPRVASGTLPF